MKSEIKLRMEPHDAFPIVPLERTLIAGTTNTANHKGCYVHQGLLMVT